MEEKSRTFSLCRLPLRTVQMVMVAAFLLMNCLPALAQSGVKVQGVVKADSDGFPLIGVNVIQKGTTNGTVTDFDGNYELTVPVGADLELSYIGFHSQVIKVVSGKTTYDVILKEDSQSLDEVVVVGYGVQKKKLVTGATVQVKGDDIQKLSTTSAYSALQGQTPGVNITQQSGKPGDGYKVTIRGLGTVGDSRPLYVIDGVPGGDLSLLNPSDIESVDVLKDAASAAIYGSRAANGVILVTTKQGKSGKMQITYDGYVGVQNVYKMPSLLNAQEYMAIQDEVRFNEGNPGYDWANVLPDYLYQSIQNGSWKGTNWLEEMRNKNALTQNHSFNLTGGNEMSTFSMGFSYSNQEGILGKPMTPEFNRYTTRINSEHVLLKGNGFNIITISENMLYNYNTNSHNIATSNIYWNDVHNAMIANPLMPVYNSNGDYYDRPTKEAEGWDFDGRAANPIALMALSSRGQNVSKNHSLRMNATIEIQPIKDLKLRSQFGYNMTAGTYRSYNAEYALSSDTNREDDQVSQSSHNGYDISWQNTLGYTFKVNEEHSFDALIGQSLEKSGMGSNLEASASKTLFPGKFNYAWLDNAKPTEMKHISANGYPWGEGSSASFFGRVNYNFRETYMASFSLRADGSSAFARGNRWGYFPSVSAGWVMTNEAFMENTRNWMDFFKVRASWGQNGNNRIAGFQYLATVSFDSSNAYYFNDNKTSQTVGAYADILPNVDLKWETSEQLNLGFDARFLSSRLGVNFDWFKKTQKDWLVVAPQLASFGTGAPYINGGNVENKGIELALTWNDQVGDFSYGVSWNMDYTKNEITKIANSEGIIHGEVNVLSQGTGEMYRAEVGKPIGYFYGYKTEGVYQNQAEIDARREANLGVLSNAQPGDLIFKDVNGDGIIDENDKTMIGNPHPDVTMGLTLTFGYKGFDLSMTGRAVFGNQIAKSYRSFADSPYQNYTTEVFGRWTGEGSSNKLPRLTSGSHTNYQNISDIFIENGDYFRMQNITLGYDFKKLFPNMVFGQARLYFTAQNLFTITGYSGMDPEVGYGGDTDSSTSANHGRWASGIDLGYYPASRSYLIGVNLKF